VEKIYEIRDPIHRFIVLNAEERALVDTRPLQRLRRIKQLAFTNMVYPGAEHTRFVHTLGVAHLAGRAFDLLVTKESDYLQALGYKPEDLKRTRQVLRFAALLHDTGHPPFSHAAERDLFPQRKNENTSYTHEDYSIRVISLPEVREVLEGSEWKISPEEVSALITGKTDERSRVWTQLLSADLDVDRMDYLLRDSLATGASYGLFDVDRLLRTLTINPDEGSLALEEGGVNAAEGLIYARYFMFAQIYFHKTRRAYDLLLTDFLRKILPAGNFPEPDLLEEYLDWDDFRVMELIRQKTNEIESAKNILQRNHNRQVHSTTDYPEAKECRLFVEMRDRIRQKFFASNPEILKEDYAENAPHKFQKNEFFVKGETTGRFIRIDQVSKLVANLHPIEKMRLYVPKDEKLQEIRKFVREHGGDWDL